MAALVSIQVGSPQQMPTDPDGEPWVSAFIKQTVEGRVALRRLNLDGDQQADEKNHGGPDKAVCVYSAERYDHWRSALPHLPWEWGAFGENFTVSGLTEDTVCIGDVYRVGNALVEVSQPRQPCWKISRRWGVDDLAAQVTETGYTGWYLRVLEEGQVESGIPLVRVERPHPTWTIAAANRVKHHDKQDAAAAQSLAECEALSEAWRDSLEKRVQRLQK